MPQNAPVEGEAPGEGPYAALIEQLQPHGPAFTIMDHRADLVAAADPGLRATTAPARAGGFACSAFQTSGRGGAPLPWQEGAGELGAEAFLLGALWVRGRRRRS